MVSVFLTLSMALLLLLLSLLMTICRTDWPLLSPAGLGGRKCNVVPKDLYVEVGSSPEITCHSWCVRGKIYWTLNNRRLDQRLSKTINASHTVLSLEGITEPVATLQCHSSDIQQVLGGTTITTYSKKCFWCSLAILDANLGCLHSQTYKAVVHVAPDSRRSARTVYMQLGTSGERAANQLLCTVVSLAPALCD